MRLAVFVDWNSNNTLNTNIKRYCPCRKFIILFFFFFYDSFSKDLIQLLNNLWF